MLLKRWFALFLVLSVLAAGCGGSSSSSNNSGGIDISIYSWGIDFTPETLGLTPGTDITEINLNWYSTTGSVAKARFFDGMNDFKEVTGIAQAITEAGHPSLGNTYHKATVTGLKADTLYRYWVSNDGVNWSEEYRYKTPKTNKFRFAAIGDPQLTTGNQDPTSNYPAVVTTTAAGWLETMGKVGLTGVDFIAAVGDQVDVTTNGSEAEYRNFFAPPELRSIPWAPVVGNHDRHYPFLYHYNLPNERAFAPLQSADYGNATNTQYAVVEAAGNYWYRYNNVLFVVLNNSAYPVSAAAAAPIIQRFDDTLTAAKAASPGYTWLFVQVHKSSASVADHIADKDIQYYVEAGFEELMTTHGVDFVLAGHDHVYARSYPMVGKKGGVPSIPNTAQGGGTINNPTGTIYVTMTTGSGLKYYDLFNQSGNLYVKTNAVYPYLVGGLAGSVAYMTNSLTSDTNQLNYNNAAAAVTDGIASPITDPALWTKHTGTLPVSNATYLQAKIPAFTVVDVEGNKVTFNTYNVNDTSTSIDTFTVTK